MKLTGYLIVTKEIYVQCHSAIQEGEVQLLVQFLLQLIPSNSLNRDFELTYFSLMKKFMH